MKGGLLSSSMFAVHFAHSNALWSPEDPIRESSK